MQFKLFSIPAAGDAEAEEELNRFLRSHRAVSVEKELVQGGHTAYWCFCVEYLLNSPLPESKGGGGRPRVDYKEILSADEFAVFVRLREVRKQLAATEAIPVYAVCTNEQLAAYRNRNDPGNRNNNLGLRVSRARREVEHVRRTGQGPVPDAIRFAAGQNRTARRVW